MTLAQRSWWANGERVAWRSGSTVLTGTVTVARGDYSRVEPDDMGEEWLLPNDELFKLTPELDPKNKN